MLSLAAAVLSLAAVAQTEFFVAHTSAAVAIVGFYICHFLIGSLVSLPLTFVMMS